MVSHKASLALELWTCLCFILAAHLPPKPTKKEGAVGGTF
jgi:hypothetical protein